MDGGWFFCGALIGFLWGDWFATRTTRRAGGIADPGLRLIANMIGEISTKRQFVGPGVTITRMERFDFDGEHYTLSVGSIGHPAKEPV